MTPEHWAWLAAPLAAGILMAICLVPLGHRVLSRGMVFADLAIAQWAALGSLAGNRLVPKQVVLGIPVSSLILALLAVALVHLILRYLPAHREATIGLLYVSGASLATLLVSSDPHGAQALARTLDGDLLWVTGQSLVPLAVVTLAVLGWQLLPGKGFRDRLFLVLFALSVTLTVEMAGIYVVFASLIATPLLICHHGGRPLWQAMLAAAAGQGIGLGLSAFYDLPAGPAVVLALIFTAFLARVVSGRLPEPDSREVRFHQNSK
ncbi:metal ABC transporter permease [Marinobacter sp. M1N3S26]|uniref:metal ABC transporter permease n=1 Tax=Marinobacter sp. M1N3S26 TaxID=3382299 RepID=UPI00387B761F